MGKLFDTYTQQLSNTATQATQATHALAGGKATPRGAREYVLEHWSESLRQAEEAFGRQGELFHFVRALKAHEDFAMFIDGRDALRELHAVAGDFLDPDRKSDFLQLWEAVRVPLNWKPLDVAADQAHETPLWPPDPDIPSYSLFKDIVGWMWKAKAENCDPIFFSCRDMAMRIGCSPKTISNYCFLAEQEGYLKCTKKGAYKQGASEFVVDLTKIPTVQFRVMKGGKR